jgi:hypothetical protein
LIILSIYRTILMIENQHYSHFSSLNSTTTLCKKKYVKIYTFMFILGVL